MTTVSSINLNHTALIRDLPIAFLAYEATEPYRIIDENAFHEKVALTKREEIIGRPFLEVYPDTSEEFKRTGKSAPIESIKKIVKTKRPDSLGEFKWDVLNKDGTFTVKHWKSTQYPIFDDTGERIVAVYQLTEDITEQKEAEKQLALKAYQLDQTLAEGLIGTWMWNMRNDKVYAGPSLAKIFGVSVEAAENGLSLDRFVASIHPDDRAKVSKMITGAVKTKSTFEAEYRTIDALGRVHWLIARGRVETDEHGELDRFPGVVVDITERKENEERLQFMANSMPQLVWITRPDGYHEYYNKQWYDYTGMAPGSTDGEGWNNLFHPDDQAKAWRVWKRSLKTGSPYEIEYRLYHAPSKRYRWVIGRALPLRNDAGEITKWYGTCTDIDDQRRSTDQQAFLAAVSKELVQLRDYKKTLQKIAKLTIPVLADWCMVDIYSEKNGFEQVAVAHTDKDKVAVAREYRRMNPLSIEADLAVPRILKTGTPELYSEITDELLQKYVNDEATLTFMRDLKLYSMMIVPVKQGKRTIGGITLVSSESKRHFSEEDFSTAIELSSRVSLAVTNARLYGDSLRDLKRRRELERDLRIEKQTLETRVRERTKQLQLTNQGLRDEIVRRQSAEKGLQAYSEELTRSNKELEGFAYVASHDLQEPLRKIQAFGNLLKTDHADNLSEEGVDYLDRMHAAASRMSTLIEDLLTFSRVTRARQQTRDVDLAEVLKDVISDLETRLHETGGTVKTGKLPVVCADPTHMRQLFQNLVGNAIKFHKPTVSPRVTVASRKKNSGYEITVQDNGIGFDARYADRIFAVFQRLHERSSYAGTGIGLAVCKKIVEQYDGTITATSTKGEGAVFTIWLPINRKK